MKESNFKLTQTIYDVVKLMDDKTAGRLFKSVCDYAFNGKAYDGNNVVIKSNRLNLTSKCWIWSQRRNIVEGAFPVTPLVLLTHYCQNAHRDGHRLMSLWILNTKAIQHFAVSKK